jgi:C-terminal processing protease CtpA/Prc
MLESAAKLEKAISASKQRCDATAVWDTGKLPCSLLVKGFLFTSQSESSQKSDNSKSDSFDSRASESIIFQPSHYVYARNPEALLLYVAVDRNTWSAAEYFAAMMQDNHAATIVGEVTGGAGCGYTNGGIPAKLKISGAQLKMPDCVRYRADGSNEVNGITPEMLLPWSGHDSDYQRAKTLLAALQAQVRAVH